MFLYNMNTLCDMLYIYIIICDNVLKCLASVVSNMVNLFFESVSFPDALKEALVHPPLKKILLNMEIFKNYRPTLNVVFVEKVDAIRLHKHSSSTHGPTAHKQLVTTLDYSYTPPFRGPNGH